MSIPLVAGMALIHGPTCKQTQQALRFLALSKRLLSKSHGSTNSGSHNTRVPMPSCLYFELQPVDC